MLKRTDPSELFEVFPVARKDWMVPCSVYKDGQEFLIEGRLQMPQGFCESAWHALYPILTTLRFGGDFTYFDEKGTSINCCTDGMRPVVFKLERL